MDQYKELCEKLRNTYKSYELTGNKNCNIARMLFQAAEAIEDLTQAAVVIMHERDMLQSQLDIAERVFMRGWDSED